MDCTRLGIVLWLTAPVLAVGGGSVGEILVEVDLVAGFVPHQQVCPTGRIDWTGGYLEAAGRGIAESTDNQGQLMAKRAATLDAAANALASAAGINLDANGRAGGVRNGRVMLDGVVKGHEVTSVRWRPDLDPPEMHVRLRVPLWGVKSVASVCYEAHRRYVASTVLRAVPLAKGNVDVSDAVLVIDARGTGLEASLFPVVVTEGGALLYDVTRVSGEGARSRPAARFVETEESFERLHSRATPPPSGGAAGRARLVTWREPAEGESIESASPTSQPTTQPASQTRRRPRRRVVVKGAATVGDQKTRLVLAAEDAEKLSNSPEGSSLLREGQVVIVVDSAAAGTQGRRDGTPESIPSLARSD
ncbi:MAG: hypothetical protein GY842_09640 [bacterium]|nr:hypothetical protein [bacterium]